MEDSKQKIHEKRVSDSNSDIEKNLQKNKKCVRILATKMKEREEQICERGENGRFV